MADQAEPSQRQLINSDNDAENQREVSSLKPWEQHGGVISLPRFDYNAPSSLLNHSHSGFLITCTIKREKSATKEAMSFLGKYLGSLSRSGNESDETVFLRCKRRKTSDDESVDAVNKSGIEANSGTLSSSNTDAEKDKNSGLSLVKLTKSGLLLFTFTKDTSFDVVRPVLDIIHALETQASASPQWCHRIFPIQATCVLNEPELRATVSKLVLEFVNNKQNTVTRPLKFAVGYNRRGVEESASTTPSLLDRNNCFSVVAAALNDVVPDSVVDLKCPEVSVLVEILPVSGLAKGSSVVAVSVLPRNLVSPKPRLCVRPLPSNVKPTKQKP